MTKILIYLTVFIVLLIVALSKKNLKIKYSILISCLIVQLFIGMSIIESGNIFKISISFAIMSFFVVGIFYSIYESIKREKAKRIIASELGPSLRKYLPRNCDVYKVLSYCVEFISNGKEYYVEYSKFGYDYMPESSLLFLSDELCGWLLENIVDKPQNYKLSPIIENYEETNCDSPSYSTVTKTYNGYRVDNYSATYSYKTKQRIIGYKIETYRYIDSQKEIPLKKW